MYAEICKDDYGIVEEFRKAMPSDLFGCFEVVVIRINPFLECVYLDSTRTRQDCINEIIILKFNPLVVVDFRSVSVK